MRIENRAAVVGILGTTQTLSWASSYYLPAVLAAPIARDLNVTMPIVFAAFSVALLVSACLGTYGGRAIDRRGGRPVLLATNVIFAAGLAGLSAVEGVVGMFAAWVVIGIAMGTGLYEAAFSTIVRLYGVGSRKSITGITLIAGFASTLGWPLSAWLDAHFGWRGACVAWAALHLTLGLGLNALLPDARAAAPMRREQTHGASGSHAASRTEMRAAVLLSLVFAVTWFISTAMAAHLPRLLEASGATLAAAVAFAALVGPSQVAARLLELGLMRHVHVLRSAQLATLAHPIGAMCLMLIGSPVAAVFTVLHGVGNGILTIANGTLPLVVFGIDGYGRRQGLLMVPARIVQAFAPFVFGLCIDVWGSGALWLSTALGVLAFAALVALARLLARRDSDIVRAP